MGKSTALTATPNLRDEEPPPIGDLLGQHEALAIRFEQLFARCPSYQPAVIAAGHGVFIRRGSKTYCVTILNHHLLLADCADNRVLGKYSSPAGICRHLAACGFQ